MSTEEEDMMMEAQYAADERHRDEEREMAEREEAERVNRVLLDDIEDHALSLATTEVDVTHDDMALLLTQIASVERRVKQMKAAVNQKLITWLPLHGGVMIIGDEEITIGKDKKVECKDNSKALEALYMAAVNKTTGEADYEAVCACLSKNALKHGAAKKLLGDAVYKQHFTESFPGKVKVKKLNTKFIKSSVVDDDAEEE